MLYITAESLTPTCLKSLEAIKRIYASKIVLGQRQMTTLPQVGTPQIGVNTCALALSASSVVSELLKSVMTCASLASAALYVCSKMLCQLFYN